MGADARSGREHGSVTKPQHRADLFVDPASDPREEVLRSEMSARR